jgi:IMP dehydrogenase
MLKLRQDVGLTFDDVLLVPKRSPVRSRGDVSTATQLSRHISMEIPIVSANMDTVTEWRMAVAMARLGGIGIIHRFMTAERQAQEIKRAKRAESHIVESPQTVLCGARARDARAVMTRSGIGGLMVVDENGKVAGILTNRDLQFAADDSDVCDLMTPAARLVTAPEGTRLEDAQRILQEHRLEKLPLLDDAGRLAGLITIKDILRLLQHPQATKDHKGRLRIGAAIGVQRGLHRARTASARGRRRCAGRRHRSRTL